MSDLTRDEKATLVAVARKIISEEIDFLDGCHEIAHLLIGFPYENDQDLCIFVLVNSETDHLPLGSTRKHWDPTALEKRDKEIQNYIDRYKKDVVIASRNIILRFTPPA